MVRGTISDVLKQDGQSAKVIAAKQAAPLEAFERKRQQDLEARRAARQAEGGRGGGLNERQQDVERAPARPEDEGGYDDFGRRVAGRAKPASEAVSCKPSKADRAAAALERLRQKGRQQQSGDSHREDDRGGRSRSRSPR
mmetsp:Transcript_89856/g.155537  ORF Transcript_89856/g.155537 Transcript_89856/m.155537 type:complete len:140 (-) Transcript_89856:58-477(-)